jgi:hypothetical protein
MVEETGGETGRFAKVTGQTWLQEKLISPIRTGDKS